MAEQSTYPMMSEKNWWLLRDRFKASMPAAVSANYIKSLLTLSSDVSANNNVMVPMRRLGLLDDENKTTALANEWRIDSTYNKACNAMIKTVYPQELIDLFPEKTVDRSVAKNWFMGHGVGNRTADSMVALFTLIKNGEIKEKPNKTTTTTKKPQQKSKVARTNNDAPKVHDVNPSPVAPIIKDANTPANTGNRPNLHIDLQIHISPESTPEQIETIFACMAKHLYGVDNS